MSEPKQSNEYKERNKKIVVILLLILCSGVTLYLLLTEQSWGHQQKLNLSQTDTLLVHEFKAFNIPKQQIHIYSVKTGSLLDRKVYYVQVPAAFSKTYFHAELAALLQKYNVTTPARVHLPAKDMDIDLYYHNTIIRTLQLRTNPDLVLERNPGSILVYTDHKPDVSLIDKLISKGLDIPLVFKINDAAQAKEWKSVLQQKDIDTYYWLTGPDDASKGKEIWYLNEQLNNLKKIFQNPTALLFPAIDPQSKNIISKDRDLLGISTIDASNALMVNGNDNHLDFDHSLQQFINMADNGKRPVLLIKATDDNIAWLGNELPQYQKAGLLLVPPIIQRH